MDTGEAAHEPKFAAIVAEYPDGVYISYPVTSMLDFLKFFRGVAININPIGSMGRLYIYLH